MIITTQRLYYCLLSEPQRCAAHRLCISERCKVVAVSSAGRNCWDHCFPTGGWFLRGRLYLILFVQLVAYLYCYNSYRPHAILITNIDVKASRNRFISAISYCDMCGLPAAGSLSNIFTVRTAARIYSIRRHSNSIFSQFNSMRRRFNGAEQTPLESRLKSLTAPSLCSGRGR